MNIRRQPVQERSSGTVQQILEAASALLARMPVDQLTTSRVAAEAGVSVGGLYRFFPDKQSILDAIAVRRVEEFQSLVESRLAEPVDGPQLLFLMIDVYVDFLDAHPDFRAIALGRHVSALTRQQQLEPGAGPASLLNAFLPAGEDFGLQVRIAMEAGERLIDFAFEQPTPAGRARVVNEIKKLLCGYLFAPAS